MGEEGIGLKASTDLPNTKRRKDIKSNGWLVFYMYELLRIIRVLNEILVL
jgi:hypothetical protein